MVTPVIPRTTGFNCPNCGAAVELRALRHAVSVACTSCGAILDPTGATLIRLQAASERLHITPTIPLGTRGSWHGHPFEVVGFQRRAVEVDDVLYAWDEYVLFNPYQGFRYLTEYDGHWNDVRTVRDLPVFRNAGKRPTVDYQATVFRHFQTATANTQYVVGEFPWRIQADDAVEASDFIAPPLLLSRESNGSEYTWSLGVYVPGAQVWSSFHPPGTPPAPRGIYANQPSPHVGQAGRYWAMFGLLTALLLLVFLGREVTAAREEIFRGDYTFRPATASEASFVTEPFRVAAPGTIDVEIQTALTDAWIYLDLALVNLDSGTALNISREVSYYTGRDSDGAWSEGRQSERIHLPAVAAGEYYLRVEPEAPPPAVVGYRLIVRRDVPQEWPYGVTLLLLLVPPVLITIRAASFEGRRWQESDYAG